MDPICDLDIVFFGTDLNIKDGAQCHRKKALDLESEDPGVTTGSSTFWESPGQLRPQLPSL